MERTRGERLSGMLATNSNKFDHQTQVLPSMCVRMYGYVAPPSTGVSSKILEWVAMSSSRGSSQPRDGTQISLIAGRFFTS